MPVIIFSSVIAQEIREKYPTKTGLISTNELWQVIEALRGYYAHSLWEGYKYGELCEASSILLGQLNSDEGWVVESHIDFDRVQVMPLPPEFLSQALSTSSPASSSVSLASSTESVQEFLKLAKISPMFQFGVYDEVLTQVFLKNPDCARAIISIEALSFYEKFPGITPEWLAIFSQGDADILGCLLSPCAFYIYDSCKMTPEELSTIGNVEIFAILTSNEALEIYENCHTSPKALLKVAQGDKKMLAKIVSVEAVQTYALFPGKLTPSNLLDLSVSNKALMDLLLSYDARKLYAKFAMSPKELISISPLNIEFLTLLTSGGGNSYIYDKFSIHPKELAHLVKFDSTALQWIAKEEVYNIFPELTPHELVEIYEGDIRILQTLYKDINYFSQCPKMTLREWLDISGRTPEMLAVLLRGFRVYKKFTHIIPKTLTELSKNNLELVKLLALDSWKLYERFAEINPESLMSLCNGDIELIRVLQGTTVRHGYDDTYKNIYDIPNLNLVPQDLLELGEKDPAKIEHLKEQIVSYGALEFYKVFSGFSGRDLVEFYNTNPQVMQCLGIYSSRDPATPFTHELLKLSRGRQDIIRFLKRYDLSSCFQMGVDLEGLVKVFLKSPECGEALLFSGKLSFYKAFPTITPVKLAALSDYNPAVIKALYDIQSYDKLKIGPEEIIRLSGNNPELIRVLLNWNMQMFWEQSPPVSLELLLDISERDPEILSSITSQGSAACYKSWSVPELIRISHGDRKLVTSLISYYHNLRGIFEIFPKFTLEEIVEISGRNHEFVRAISMALWVFKKFPDIGPRELLEISHHNLQVIGEITVSNAWPVYEQCQITPRELIEITNGDVSLIRELSSSERFYKQFPAIGPRELTAISQNVDFIRALTNFLCNDHTKKITLQELADVCEGEVEKVHFCYKLSHVFYYFPETSLAETFKEFWEKDDFLDAFSYQMQRFPLRGLTLAELIDISEGNSRILEKITCNRASYFYEQAHSIPLQILMRVYKNNAEALDEALGGVERFDKVSGGRYFNIKEPSEIVKIWQLNPALVAPIIIAHANGFYETLKISVEESVQMAQGDPDTLMRITSKEALDFYRTFPKITPIEYLALSIEPALQSYIGTGRFPNTLDVLVLKGLLSICEDNSQLLSILLECTIILGHDNFVYGHSVKRHYDEFRDKFPDITLERLVALSNKDPQLLQELISPEVVQFCETFSITPEELLARGGVKILETIQNDQINAVRCLLARGMDVNGRDKDGRTPLHKIAAMSMDQNLMSSARDSFSHHSPDEISNNILDIVRLLLEAGAEPNAEDNNGETPLMKCWASEDIAPILLGYGANIDKKYKKYTVSIVDKTYEFESGTLLTKAALNLDNDDVMYLLSRGADPHILDKYGQSAVDLYLSDRRTFVESFTLRVSAIKGAITYEDKLQLFNRAGERKIIEFKYGVAFRATAMGNHDSLTKIIHKGDFDVAHLNKRGQSFLYVACYNRHPNIVDLLLNTGADPNIGWPNNHITPAMVIAGNCGDVFLNTAEDYCCPGLFLSDHGHKEKNFATRAEILNLLVARGADLSIQDIQGMTAYAIAKNNCIGPIFETVITTCVQRNLMPQTMGDQILSVRQEYHKSEIGEVERLMSGILYDCGLAPNPMPHSALREELSDSVLPPSLETLVESGWMFYMNHPEYMSNHGEDVLFGKETGIMFILRCIRGQVSHPEPLKRQLSTLVDTALQVNAETCYVPEHFKIIRKMLNPAIDTTSESASEGVDDVTSSSPLLPSFTSFSASSSSFGSSLSSSSSSSSSQSSHSSFSAFGSPPAQLFDAGLGGKGDGARTDGMDPDKMVECLSEKGLQCPIVFSRYENLPATILEFKYPALIELIGDGPAHWSLTYTEFGTSFLIWPGEVPSTILHSATQAGIVVVSIFQEPEACGEAALNYLMRLENFANQMWLEDDSSAPDTLAIMPSESTNSAVPFKFYNIAFGIQNAVNAATVGTTFVRKVCQDCLPETGPLRNDGTLPGYLHDVGSILPIRIAAETLTIAATSLAIGPWFALGAGLSATGYEVASFGLYKLAMPQVQSAFTITLMLAKQGITTVSVPFCGLIWGCEMLDKILGPVIPSQQDIGQSATIGVATAVAVGAFAAFYYAPLVAISSACLLGYQAARLGEKVLASMDDNGAAKYIPVLPSMPAAVKEAMHVGYKVYDNLFEGAYQKWLDANFPQEIVGESCEVEVS